MKRIVYLLLLVPLISCQGNKTESKNKDSNQSISVNKLENIDTAEACAWLKSNIEKFFKNYELSVMQDLTTKEYYDYKMDAMNVDLDLDGSLSTEEFNNKWKGKFDLKYAGIGQGFLISGQDFGEIKVSTCDLIHQAKGKITLKTIISDCEFQTDYPREITLIKEDKGFKIKDVKEFN